MKIDLGLAVVIGSAILGLSIVVGSSIIASKSNFVRIGDTALLNTTTGDRFFNTSIGRVGSPVYDRIPGPSDRKAKIENAVE